MKMAKRRNPTTIFGVITIGTVLVGSWLFFMVGAATGFFPEDWFQKSLIYFVLTIGVFAWDNASTRKFEQTLFRKSFISIVPKFLLFAGLTYGLLFFTKLLIQPEILDQILQRVIGDVPLYVALYHGLIVGVNETLVFMVFFADQFRSRGLSKNSTYIFVGLLFALFHFWLVGGVFLLLLPYIPLGIIWLWMRWKYGWEAAAGSHGLGYNPFILGFGA